MDRLTRNLRTHVRRRREELLALPFAALAALPPEGAEEADGNGTAMTMRTFVTGGQDPVEVVILASGEGNLGSEILVHDGFLKASDGSTAALSAERQLEYLRRLDPPDSPGALKAPR